jgi:hypothetical protein
MHPTFWLTPAGEEENMKKSVTAMMLLLLGVFGLSIEATHSAQGEKNVDTRVFELRTYHAAPGKMEALHARFRDHTCKLFKKHDMTIIGFWTPADAKEAEKTLVYLLAFPSREAADQSWKAFMADPQWKAAKEASEKDGKLVEKVERVFLNPTDYSPLK